MPTGDSPLVRNGRRLGTAIAAVGVGATAVPPAYLGALTVLGAKPHRCGRTVGPRFSIVVPAHDEADTIESTLASLALLDYPAELVDITVVADNCTDETAERARRAGVTVIERDDPDRRGKGYALELAFATIIDAQASDAVVVIDADTLVDAHFLQHAAFHLDDGAAAVQVDYRIRNPHASWRTRLVDLAFTCKHRVRSRGRDTLGASAGLRGNGMVFAVDTLSTTPYAAFSVVEDVEYAIALGLRGTPVQGCDATHVAGDMPATADSAHSQRVRWELGNQQLRREHGWPLMRRAARTRNVVETDMAADVLLPPLASIGVSLTLSTVASVALRNRVGSIPIRVAALAWAALATHIIAGVALSQSRWRCLPALAQAPLYVVWKIGVRLSGTWREQARGDAVWTRTERSTQAREPNAHHAGSTQAAATRPKGLVPAR